MNTSAQRLFALILLGGALLFLPACGSKSEVKSQKASETVLNPDSSFQGTADLGDKNGRTPINTYVEKMGSRSSHSSAKNSSMPNTAAAVTPVTPIQSTPAVTPAVDTTVPVKKGHSSILWWILLVLILGGIGWYFWSKNQPDEHSSQPTPPVGGLSPVSGFTAVKDQIEDEAEAKPSFWNRKLF